MSRVLVAALCCIVLTPAIVTAAAKCSVSCLIGGLASKNHNTLRAHITPTDGDCHAGTRHGFPIPDRRCTPGAINPTVTLAVLKNSNFRTCCIRDKVESESAKDVAYGWYGIHKPARNKGQDQFCELDHLVPLELGGADSMDNVWPQCGPDAVTLKQRFFKQKDQVESFLAAQVKTGTMDLSTAQKAIAADYTQFLKDAKKFCSTNSCSG
jgi:5-methylcytosine-specific restriction endonuclease McrA